MPCRVSQPSLQVEPSAAKGAENDSSHVTSIPMIRMIFMHRIFDSEVKRQISTLGWKHVPLASFSLTCGSLAFDPDKGCAHLEPGIHEYMEVGMRWKTYSEAMK